MMEYVLRSSNLHNVMETDTTAAKMWYLICDHLPSVFRSSIFCQHKLKWVSGMGSISVPSRAGDICSTAHYLQSSIKSTRLLHFLRSKQGCCLKPFTLPQHNVCILKMTSCLLGTLTWFFSHFPWFPMKIKGPINTRTIWKSHYFKHIQHLPSGEEHFALRIPSPLEL